MGCNRILISYYHNIFKPIDNRGGLKMATCGYSRVSTLDQNLDAQLEELTKAGATSINSFYQ
jgi:hypothetical protein